MVGDQEQVTLHAPVFQLVVTRMDEDMRSEDAPKAEDCQAEPRGLAASCNIAEKVTSQGTWNQQQRQSRK